MLPAARTPCKKPLLKLPLDSSLKLSILVVIKYDRNALCRCPWEERWGIISNPRTAGQQRRCKRAAVALHALNRRKLAASTRHVIATQQTCTSNKPSLQISMSLEFLSVCSAACVRMAASPLPMIPSLIRKIKSAPPSRLSRQPRSGVHSAMISRLTATSLALTSQHTCSPGTGLGNAVRQSQHAAATHRR